MPVFFTLLQILFIGLKLSNQIDWTWGLVFSPFWGYLSFAILVRLIIGSIVAADDENIRTNSSAGTAKVIFGWTVAFGIITLPISLLLLEDWIRFQLPPLEFLEMVYYGLTHMNTVPNLQYVIDHPELLQGDGQ